MGTLYVVGGASGTPSDLTLRAVRTLKEVDLVAAEDANHARDLLLHHQIDTQFVTLEEQTPAQSVDSIADRLERHDVALLTAGWSPGLSGPGRQLVRRAISRGYPIASVPGPSPPVTALILSGLPSNAFVYLGELQAVAPSAAARQELLASVAGEPRTLVILARQDYLPSILSELGRALGPRPLVIVPLADQGTTDIWRGTLEAPEYPPYRGAGTGPELHALIIAGATEPFARWEEDRLRAEIRLGLDQNLGAKKISQQLASRSGWPRRQIYRLAVQAAVEMAQFPDKG